MAHEIEARHRLNDGVLCGHIVHDPLVFLPDDLGRPHRVQILVHQISEARISSSFVISSLLIVALDEIALCLILAIIRPQRRGARVRPCVGNACFLPLRIVSEGVECAYTEAHRIL